MSSNHDCNKTPAKKQSGMKTLKAKYKKSCCNCETQTQAERSMQGGRVALKRTMAASTINDFTCNTERFRCFARLCPPSCWIPFAEKPTAPQILRFQGCVCACLHQHLCHTMGSMCRDEQSNMHKPYTFFSTTNGHQSANESADAPNTAAAEPPPINCPDESKAQRRPPASGNHQRPSELHAPPIQQQCPSNRNCEKTPAEKQSGVKTLKAKYKKSCCNCETQPTPP